MDKKPTSIPFLIILTLLSLIISSNPAQKAYAYSQVSSPGGVVDTANDLSILQPISGLVSQNSKVQNAPNSYPLNSGYPLNVDSWLEKTPVTIADINGDGSNEMLLPTYSGQVFAWNASGALLPGFPINTGGAILGRLTLGDLDQDGKLEIAAGVGTLSNGVGVQVYIWRFDGTLFPGWPQSTACDDPTLNCIMLSIVFADLDSDANLEVIAATNNGEGWEPNPYESYPSLYVWHSDGQIASGNWPVADEYDVRIGGAIAVGDLNGDGTADVALGRDYNRLFAYDKSGNNLPGWPHNTWWPYDNDDWNDDKDEYARSAVTLADLDGDGTLEYIVNGLRRYAQDAIYYNTDLLVYNSEGARWPNWEIPASGSGVLSQTTWRMLEAPAIGDINRDYHPDIVVTTQDGWVRAYTAEKQLLWAFDYAQGQMIYATEAVIGDVNGDGWNEVIFGTFDVDFGSPGPFGIFILDHNGIPLPDANPLVVDSNYGVSGAPALADLDGDGNIEIAATTYDGLIYVWDATGEATPGHLPWPMARHDLQRTGYYFDPSPNFIESHKTPSNFTPQPGETVSITIDLIQSGTARDETIQLTETLPAGLTYIPGSLVASSGSVDDSQAPTLLWTGSMYEVSEVVITYATQIEVNPPEVITSTSVVDVGSAGNFELTTTLIVNGQRFFLPIIRH
jgi:uncharacterized repeat protein (TIGR01451 family)